MQCAVDVVEVLRAMHAYPLFTVDHGLGRPRILVAEPGTDGFRALQVPMGSTDMDAIHDETCKLTTVICSMVGVNHARFSIHHSCSTCIG